MRILNVAVFLALAGLAHGAAAQTVLTLNATGQNQATPDQAVATLTVQAAAKDAAGAQGQVNKLMADALAEVGGVQGLKATTGGYGTYSSTPDNSTTPQFTAQETLTLTQPALAGVPSDAFTALLGKLQGQGLLLNGLDGTLSTAGQEQAMNAAIADGLRQIQDQAKGIADALHQHVGTIKTLNVNAGGFAPGPRPMMAMAARVAAPSSVPDNVAVQASVTAEIELLGQ